MSELTDQKYQIAPGVVNFTAWSRDNIPKGDPKFKVGDRVFLSVPLFITIVGQDCDGTPLFAASLSNPLHFTEAESARMSDWTLQVNCLSADSFTPRGEDTDKRP